MEPHNNLNPVYDSSLNKKFRRKIIQVTSLDLYTVLQPIHVVCNTMALLPWVPTIPPDRKLKRNKLLFFYSIFGTCFMIINAIIFNYRPVTINKLRDIVQVFLVYTGTTNTISMLLFGIYNSKCIKMCLEDISRVDMVLRKYGMNLEYQKSRIYITISIFLKLSTLFCMTSYDIIT